MSKKEKYIAAKVNGEIIDLSRVSEGAEGVEYISPESDEGLEIIRHSCAHLMAQAVERLYPGTHFGIGPAIKDGFYYDIDLGNDAVITENDLAAIEAEMRKISAQAEVVTREDLTCDDALNLFKDDPYKTELISELKAEGVSHVSVYKQGEYKDLCRGRLILSTLNYCRLRAHTGAAARKIKCLRAFTARPLQVKMN